MIIDYNWDYKKEEISLDLDFFDEKLQEDKIWQEKTNLNYESLSAAIEAIIFLSDKPISIQKIRQNISIEIPLRCIHQCIENLQSNYEEKRHGIRLLEVAEGFQFRTKMTVTRFIQNAVKASSFSLSPSAMEVLAIIAYKQPATKMDIENIRGVDSTHLIRMLMDRRLVKISGRSEELGKPTQYATTLEFLDVFNLANISDLPSETSLLELCEKQEIGKIKDIKNIVGGNDKSKFMFDEYQELDLLHETIKNISSETFFIKHLKEEQKNQGQSPELPRKSAFDLLDEFLIKKEMMDANLAASQSALILPSPHAITVATSDLDNELNVPQFIEDDLFDEDSNDEMEFEIAEKMDFQAESEIDDSDLNSVSLSDLKDTSLLNDENFQSEEAELEDALDAAFNRLMDRSSQLDELLAEPTAEKALHRQDDEDDEEIEESEANLSKTFDLPPDLDLSEDQ
jgi:segregation and condensation protein B